jgi:hypothetical protein
MVGFQKEQVMKRMMLVFLLCITGLLFASFRQVSLQEATRIAEAHARSAWSEDVYAAEPIPLYGPEDNIIAWQFNFSLGRPFPDKQSLQQRCAEAFASGNRNLGWGNDDFGNMIIGANRGMPVYAEYGKNLSPQYALSAKLAETASREFPHGYSYERDYYFGHLSVWHCISDGNVKKYVNLLPYPVVKNETEFRNMLSGLTFFWQRDSFEQDWERVLDQGIACSSLSAVYPGIG